MAEIVVYAVVEKISGLLLQEVVGFSSGLGEDIERLQIDLRWMQSFLKDADSRQEEDERLRLWIEEVRDLVRDAEDVIDSYVLEFVDERRKGGISNVIKRFACIFHEMWVVNNIRSRLETIRSGIGELSRRLQTYGIRELAIEDRHSYHERQRALRQSYPHIVEENIVGLEYDIKRLVTVLVDDEREFPNVVSICGMGGSGKTTLAKRIYHHSLVRNHYDCFAWVYVSQQCPPRNVWEAILSGFGVFDNQDRNRRTEQVADQLYKFLESNKCLVVLDDIWSTPDWESITMNAAMEELGRDMVKRCAGLPLAIVVLGGILATKQSIQEWEIVHDNVDYYLRRGAGRGVADVLAFSYDNLPPHLRLYFLYLSHFPEDYVIPADKLIQFWVGEGIFSSVQRDGQSLEEAAQICLRELVERYMIQVKDRDANMEIKACYMNRFMRELCISKAKKEKFILIIDGSNTNQDGEIISTSSGVSGAPRLVIHEYVVMQRIRNPRRVKSMLFFNVIFLEHLIISSLRQSAEIYLKGDESCVAVLLLVCRVMRKYHRILKYLFNNFKMLRLLDFEGADIYIEGDLLNGIGKLIYLRHFILREDASISEHLKSLSIWSPEPIDPNHLTQLLLGCVNVSELRLTVEIRKLPEHLSESLAHLYLTGSELDEDPMPTLEKLPSLKLLELKKAFTGKEICCSAQGFPQLETLMLIANSDLEEWRVDEGAMPKLHHLEIVDCRRMKTLPVGLKIIKTLREVKIEKMPKAFKDGLVEGGEDFYKVKHISSVIFQNSSSDLTFSLILKLCMQGWNKQRSSTTCKRRLIQLTVVDWRSSLGFLQCHF
ncbi:Disease resistance protein [Corchorus olitorius]|uniref:Disease resistance protein n=1 Tax=Corchorus olitorius TaxID=93759 RepID=A0A1R3K1J1_9ROSI|nr:Disease resistance protein [Corchorus olitorius]